MIVLIPIGDVSMDVLRVLERELPNVFPGTETLEEAPLNDFAMAYTPSRKQYHSTRLLLMLESIIGDMECRRALGIIESDMYVPGLNFVFGEARMPGKVGVISTARLKTKDKGLFEARLLKEAVHELGHSYGLPHCENEQCVMFFSNTIQDTDRKGERFCPSCDRRLAS